MLSVEEANAYFGYDPNAGTFVRQKAASPQIRYGAGTSVGRANKRGYVFLVVSKVRYRAHNVAWLLMTGEWPSGFVVDHKNGDPSDNRWCNLRRATLAQNARNQRRPKTNTSGHKGVTTNKSRGKPWRASIRVAGRQTHLGLFNTKEEAATAYRLAAEQHFGEFARFA